MRVSIFKSVSNSTQLLSSARANVTWSETRPEISFEFTQYLKGEKLENAEKYALMKFDASFLSPEIFTDCKASRHGLEQKLRDSLAITKEEKEKMTIADAVTILEELWIQLDGTEETTNEETGEVTPAVEGSWNKRTKTRESGAKALKELDASYAEKWAAFNEEQRAQLVMLGIYTADGKLVKK